MAILLILFLMFYQAPDLPAANMSAVDFSIVKQGNVKNESCIPFVIREITFRVKNRLSQPIYIPGSKMDSGRHPLGYLIRLDSEKNRWVDNEGNTVQRPYQEFLAWAKQFHEPEVYVLPPGKSMTFKTLAGEKEIGSKLKRGIFISLTQNEEPRMVTSEEFILR